MTIQQLAAAAVLAAVAVFATALPPSGQRRRPTRQAIGGTGIAGLLAALLVAFLGDGFGPYVESISAAFLVTVPLTYFAQTRQESRLATTARVAAIVASVSAAVLALQM